MNKFFCAAPWRGLHINPRGNVKTCCAGDPNMLGNLNEQSIEQILHSPAMQEIRQTLQQGRPHEQYCHNCVQAERHGRSERDWHNSLNPEFDCVTATNVEYTPTLIDVRWNTTCNLSCNYCGDKCSSKWAALKHVPFRSGTRPYYEQVCDYLEQHQSSIREVALVGGEPLLLPENERLLDVLPNDCIVTLITNASVNLDNNKIFNKLKTRKRVGWSLSFDNIEKRFEYVRHGGHWELLTRNLDQIQNLMQQQGHWGGIHSVYNVYNASRLVELTKFARNRGLAIVWQSLYQPDCLDPANLGKEIVAIAQQEIKNLLSLNICLADEQVFFSNVLDRLLDNGDLRNELKQHIVEIEQFHGDQQGKFRELWPEISSLL